MGKPNSETLLGMGAVDPTKLLAGDHHPALPTDPRKPGVSGTHRSTSTHEVTDPGEAPYSSLVDTRRGGVVGHPHADGPISDMVETRPGLGARVQTPQRLGTPVRVTTQNGSSRAGKATTLGTPVSPESYPGGPADSLKLTRDTLKGLGEGEPRGFDKTLPFATSPFAANTTELPTIDGHVFTSALNITLPVGTRLPDSIAAVASERIRGVASRAPETPKVYVGARPHRRTETIETPAAERITPVRPEPTPKAEAYGTMPSRIAAVRVAQSDTLETPVAGRSSEETFRPSAHTTPPGMTEPRAGNKKRWKQSALVVAAAAFVLGGASLVKQEDRATAAGVVVVRGGLTPALNQVAGSVREVLVKAGDSVSVGQAIAEMDDSVLQRRRAELKEQETALLAEKERMANVGVKLHSAATDALQRKRAVLWERLKLRKNAAATLNGETPTPTGTKDVQARDAVLLIRQELADVEFELNRRQSDRDDRDLTWERRMSDVHLALEQATQTSPTVFSPVSGYVDSVLVTPGQVLAAGSPVAHVVPEGAPTQIVLGVPVAASRRLSTGYELDVTLASLPPEANIRRARVTQIADENLSRERAAELLHTPLTEPLVEVQVELLSTGTTAPGNAALRAGERVTAQVPGESRSLWQYLTQ